MCTCTPAPIALSAPPAIPRWNLAPRSAQAAGQLGFGRRAIGSLGGGRRPRTARQAAGLCRPGQIDCRPRPVDRAPFRPRPNPADGAAGAGNEQIRSGILGPSVSSPMPPSSVSSSLVPRLIMVVLALLWSFGNLASSGRRESRNPASAGCQRKTICPQATASNEPPPWFSLRNLPIRIAAPSHDVERQFAHISPPNPRGTGPRRTAADCRAKAGFPRVLRALPK